MNRCRRNNCRLLCALVACAVAGGAIVPAGAAAQGLPGGGNGTPLVDLTVRAGIFSPRGGSDFYDFTSERLSLSDDDLRGTSLALEVSYWATDRVKVLGGVSAHHSEADSRYLDRTDATGDPLLQTTTLATGPNLYVGALAYLRPAGRAMESWNLFAGGGGGRVAYELRQSGEFWDERAELPFEEDFVSDGAGAFGFAAGGAEYGIATWGILSVQVRYHWGSADLSGDYSEDFQSLDLSGMDVTAGMSLRY